MTPPPHKKKIASFWRALGTAFSALIGLRLSRADNQPNILHIIIAGIIVVFLFVVTILFIVKFVVS